MKTFIVLVLCLVAVNAVPENPLRIVGGSVTTINEYPYGTPALYSRDLLYYSQSCGGSIINNNAILSAAHCFHGDSANRWRIRVGSTYANSGGTVHAVRTIIIHPSYNSWTLDNDIAIIRTSTNINFINNVVGSVSIAGTNYVVADHQPVWAIGWGLTEFMGSPSEQLRHVQVWIINQDTCRNRMSELGWPVTENMLCSGWLDVGGRGQCNGDSGSPVVHYFGTVPVLVGVCSWGIDCATARYGSVNTRVSRYTNWITEMSSN